MCVCPTVYANVCYVQCGLIPCSHRYKMVEMLECACAPTHLYARESSERRLTAAAERAVNAGFVWSVLTPDL